MNEYEQLSKNTVKAENQLKESEHVRFYNLGKGGRRVMFAGNSITLHGIKESIGWYGEWGMAASSMDRDYVHILMREILKTNPDTEFCVCQVAEWERQYKQGEITYHLYEAARDFGADIVLMRFAENCPRDEFDEALYKDNLSKFLTWLGSKSDNAKNIISSSFWKHPANRPIEEFAKENNLPYVPLWDLGERDEMKAIGLFTHNGVANHPGDLGMQTIADRILIEIQKLM